MGFIARFLGSYSDSFLMSLALWPLAAVVLTLPILAYLYHRDGRVRAASAAGAYASVLYLTGLACFTLYPLPEGDSGPGVTYGLKPILNPLHFIGDMQEDGIAPVAQLVANTALFVPLGFIAGRGLRTKLSSAASLGFMVSLAIELAQLTGLFGVYPYAYRTFETTDLFTNTLGAVVGWKLASLFSRAFPDRLAGAPRTVETSPGFTRRLTAFCIDMTIAAIASAMASSAALLSSFALAAPTAGVFALAFSQVCGIAAIVIVELAIPWARGGRTPGGSIVRMTCETRSRAGTRRAAFFLVRLGVILCCTGFAPIEPRLTAVGLACLAFFLFARKMPYDFI